MVDALGGEEVGGGLGLKAAELGQMGIGDTTLGGLLAHGPGVADDEQFHGAGGYRLPCSV